MCPGSEDSLCEVSCPIGAPSGSPRPEAPNATPWVGPHRDPDWRVEGRAGSSGLIAQRQRGEVGTDRGNCFREGNAKSTQDCAPRNWGAGSWPAREQGGGREGLLTPPPSKPETDMQDSEREYINGYSPTPYIHMGKSRAIRRLRHSDTDSGALAPALPSTGSVNTSKPISCPVSGKRTW